jgi:hypothetical protein
LAYLIQDTGARKVLDAQSATKYKKKLPKEKPFFIQDQAFSYQAYFSFYSF